MADRKQLWALGLSVVAVLSVGYRVLTWKKTQVPPRSAGVQAGEVADGVGETTGPEAGGEASVHVPFTGDAALLNASLAHERLAQPFVPEPLPQPGIWRPLSRGEGDRPKRQRPDFVLSGTVRGGSRKAIINHQVLQAGGILKEGGEVLEVGEGWARLRWEGEDVLLLVHPDLNVPLRNTEPHGQEKKETPSRRKVKACYP